MGIEARMERVVFKKDDFSGCNFLKVFGKFLEFMLKIGIGVGLRDLWHIAGIQTS